MAYRQGGGHGGGGVGWSADSRGVAPSIPFEEQMRGGVIRPGEPHWWETGKPGNRRQIPRNL